MNAAEILEDGKSGLLVPPGDDVALTEAINRCLDDNSLSKRLGKGAFKRVKQYDMNRIVDLTLEFYGSL